MVEANWNKGNLASSNLNQGIPLNTQQGLVKETTTTTMKPVLEKVEKIVHKDVLEREHITEQHKKDLIEVHEQPIEKRVLHPEQQIHVQEQSIYETTGSDNLLERERLLEQMRLQDRNRGVIVEEREDLRLSSQAPTVQVQSELRKEVIEKPIVTEIHEQPITEVHERNIFKTVHEAPSVTVVREAPIVENVSMSSQPMMGSGITSGTQFSQSGSWNQPTTGTWNQSTTTTGTGQGLGSAIKNKIKEKLGTTGTGSTFGTTGTTMQQPILQQQQPFVQQQPFMQQQPILQQQPLMQQQQPFVQQQPMVGSTLVEKGLGDQQPFITGNSGINPLHGTRK